MAGDERRPGVLVPHMPRPTSLRSSIVLASVTLLGATAACLTGETVDLGRLPGSTADDGPPPVEASIEASDDAAPPEAGPPDAGDAAPDAAPEAGANGSALCIPNPSFEPGPDGGVAVGPEIAVASGWSACPGSGTSVTPTSCVLPPSDGQTYLALTVGTTPFPFPFNLGSSADVQLCAPMEAGVLYTLSVEVALDAPPDDSGASDEPPSLWVLGGNSACDSQAHFFLPFSPKANFCGWRRLCGFFTPDQEYTHLVLLPEISSAGAQYPQTHVLIDDLKSGGPCTPE